VIIEVILLIVTMLITYGGMGLITWLMVKKSLADILPNPRLTALTCLGAAPILNSLFLYYLLLFFHGYPSVFYIISIVLIWFCLLLSSLSKNKIKILPIFTLNLWQKFIAVGIFIFWVTYIIKRPFTEHDPNEYANFGRGLLHIKALIYTKIPYFPENGFSYVALHGHGFPLQYTWSNLINEVFGFENTWFLQSINGYYAILFLALVYQFFYLIDKTKAAYILFFLLIPYGYFLNYFRFHMDTLRVFLFVASLLGALWYMNTGLKKALYVCVALCALHSFVHSLGIFLSAIMLGVLLLFALREKYPINTRMIFTAIALFIAMGGIHYILDVFIGTGWIFKDFDFI
jgi:hypothetical protein